jgi:hypothetical protein
VFEQGGPSGNIPVIELSSSSSEEDFFTDTTRDAKFTRWMFGDLNCDLLRPPSDGKVIVLSDSDEEEEADEETTTDVEAAPSAAVKSSTPASSATDADEDTVKMQDDNNDDLAPGQDIGRSSGGEKLHGENYIQRCGRPALRKVIIMMILPPRKVPVADLP